MPRITQPSLIAFAWPLAAAATLGCGTGPAWSEPVGERDAAVLAYAFVGDGPPHAPADAAEAMETDADAGIRADAAWAEAEALDQRQAAAAVDPSSAWLRVHGSLIYPACAAVLVAPDVAVTGLRCVQDGVGERLVGRGVPSERAGVTVHEVKPLEADPRLVALVLTHPMPDAPPPPTPLDATREPVRVRGVQLGYATRGEPASLRPWQGELRSTDDGVIVTPDPDREAPCHGDLGAGVFTSAGSLAGFVVEHITPAGADCAEAFVLAPVAPSAGPDPLVEARRAGRVTARTGATR